MEQAPGRWRWRWWPGVGPMTSVVARVIRHSCVEYDWSARCNTGLVNDNHKGRTWTDIVREQEQHGSHRPPTLSAQVFTEHHSLLFLWIPLVLLLLWLPDVVASNRVDDGSVAHKNSQTVPCWGGTGTVQRSQRYRRRSTSTCITIPTVSIGR
jgi:hypothetical protein